MQTQLQSLSTLFSERLFRIPDYQRGYAWRRKQLEDFWSDLKNLEEGNNHYTGVITLEDVKEERLAAWENDEWIITSKRYKPFYVVDGQQRLTTCIILLQCILEKVDDEVELNFTPKDEIIRKFIYDTKGRKSLLRTYMFGYEKDNPSYEFLKRKIFMEDSAEHQLEQDTIYTANLEFAKDFFHSQLINLEQDEIEVLYSKVTQHLLFNVYSISSEVDVFIAFETMNNRGKPLSHLELLKNRLIYLSTKINSPIEERMRLRHNINEAWKSIYHYLGANRDNPLSDDEFLLNHFNLYYELKDDSKYARYGRYYDVRTNHKDYIINEVFSDENIKSIDSTDDGALEFISKYVASLKQSVEVWYKIMNPDSSGYSEEERIALARLLRLVEADSRNAGRGYLILVLSVFLSINDRLSRIAFLKSYERYIFVITLVRNNVTFSVGVLDILEKSVLIYSKKEKISSLRAELDSFTQKINALADFIPALTKTFKGYNGFYGWTGITHLLYEYEDYLRTSSKNHRLRIDAKEYFRMAFRFEVSEDERDYTSIEHIYPQNPGRRLCWNPAFSKYSPAQKRALRNSLGNLLALSKPKNSSLGNKCFCEKIQSSDGHIGYVNGSYSEIEVSNNSEWTPEKILERGIKLLDFVEKRWDVKLGSSEDKKAILGLDFL